MAGPGYAPPGDPASPRVPAGPEGSPDFRHTLGFTWPERHPWSEVGPEFTARWGNADPGDPQPEHMQIFGQNGSGKTHFLMKLFQERAALRKNRAHVLLFTKQDDKVVHKLGWPVVSDWKGITENRCCIYWPRTELLEQARRDFYERRMADVLSRLQVPDSNTSIAADDAGYLDSLPRVRLLRADILREGRSLGLDLTDMRQRPQGSDRLTSSETHWTAAAKPKDRGDLERWAELFGSRRDWMPVFDSLSDLNREFILRHNRSARAVITWVDTPLVPVDPDPRPRSAWEILGLRRPADRPPRAVKR